MNLKVEELPAEIYLDIERNPNLIARIEFHGDGEKKKFHADIDLIWRESRKIFFHVESLFDWPDLNELKHQAFSVLSSFLQNPPQFLRR